MPKYLWEASYSSDGVKGVVKEGGTGRRAEAKNLVEAFGGTMEAFYFAFGDADAYHRRPARQGGRRRAASRWR